MVTCVGAQCRCSKKKVYYFDLVITILIDSDYHIVLLINLIYIVFVFVTVTRKNCT